LDEEEDVIEETRKEQKVRQKENQVKRTSRREHSWCEVRSARTENLTMNLARRYCWSS
jgi:hypothetical protein